MRNSRLCFLLHGPPRTWKRPKRHGGGYTASAGTTVHYHKLVKAFRDAALEQGVRAFTRAVGVRLHFHFEHGRSRGLTAVEIFDLRDRARRSALWTTSDLDDFDSIPNEQEIDIDNLEKLVLEAAQNSGVLASDGLVAYVEKWKTGTTKKVPALEALV